MVIPVNKLAPSAVVLACVSYCVWPSISDLAGKEEGPKSPAKVAELSAALFSPAMPRRPTKNPWGGRDAVTLAELRSNAATGKEPAADSKGGRAVVSLADIKLEATCTIGNRQLAVINGRVYAAEEMLAPPNPGAAPCKIIRVLPHKVLLECGGKTLTLNYSDAASGAAPAANTGGVAKTADAATAPAAKPLVMATADVKSSGKDVPEKTEK